MKGFSKLLRRSQTEEEEQEHLQQAPGHHQEVTFEQPPGPSLGDNIDLPPVDQSDEFDNPPNHPPPPVPGSEKGKVLTVSLIRLP